MNNLVDPLNQNTEKAIEDFGTLHDKLFNESRGNSKKFPDGDIRTHFFFTLCELNIWMLINLRTFREMLDESDKKIANYLKLPEKGKIQVLVAFDIFNRITYTTQFMFQVEDFIKNLLKALNEPPKNRYYEFTKQFLKKIKKFRDQSWRILVAPSQLRNSLHNNGFAYDDFFIRLKGKDYRFIKGQRIDCGGWDTLFIFLNNLVDILVDGIKSEKLEAIKFIPHTYIVPEVTFPNKS